MMKNDSSLTHLNTKKGQEVIANGTNVGTILVELFNHELETHGYVSEAWYAEVINIVNKDNLPITNYMKNHGWIEKAVPWCKNVKGRKIQRARILSESIPLDFLDKIEDANKDDIIKFALACVCCYGAGALTKFVFDKIRDRKTKSMKIKEDMENEQDF